MNAGQSNAAVEVVAPVAAVTATESGGAANTHVDKAVAKDQPLHEKDSSDAKKKKPWYKRMKLQPVIYRHKCGI